MRHTVAPTLIAVALLAVTAACSGDADPSEAALPATPPTLQPATPPATSPAGDGHQPEIRFGCDSPELAAALAPVLPGSGFDLEIGAEESDRLSCLWQGDPALVSVDISAVDPVDAPRSTRADLEADDWQLFEEPRLDVFDADAAGKVTQLTTAGVSFYITTVIVTNDSFKITVAVTDQEGGNDRPVGDAAIQTAELVFGA